MRAEADDPTATDECAAALMGVLLQRLCDPERQHALEQAGWLMGLLAHGLGVELLGERRERRGLEPLLELARASLRAQGRELAPVTTALPDVGRAVDGGPAACWTVVRLLWHAARESAAPLRWSLTPLPGGEHALCVDAPASSGMARLAAEAARGLPGARFEPADGAWSLCFSPGSFT
jgi:hypothetical protein